MVKRKSDCKDRSHSVRDKNLVGREQSLSSEVAYQFTKNLLSLSVACYARFNASVQVSARCRLLITRLEKCAICALYCRALRDLGDPADSRGQA